MKIAIDIDGTITRYPRQMQILLGMFPDSVVLTGSLNDNPDGVDRKSLIEGRLAQLETFIGKFSGEVHVCVGRDVREVAKLKGEFCRDNNIVMFIDDALIYCEAVNKLSPKTAVLKVYEVGDR